MTILRALAPYARRATPRTAEATSSPVDDSVVCELCAAPVEAEHSHVVEIGAHRLLCTCRPCALLFTAEARSLEGGASRYRTVPRRILRDPSNVVSERDWDALQIPVRLAFVLFDSSLARWAAFYPSPAGAVASELSLEAWSELAERVPILRAAEPDTEALLFHGGLAGGAPRVLVVPIVACYELVAHVRTAARSVGIDGARRAADAFVDALEGRSAPFQERDR